MSDFEQWRQELPPPTESLEQVASWIVDWLGSEAIDALQNMSPPTVDELDAQERAARYLFPNQELR